MSFRKLEIKTKYRSQSENYINVFYNPVLRESIQYDRVSAYFSIPIIREYIEGVKNIALKNGKLRFIISPIINKSDIDIFVRSIDIRDYVFRSISKLFDELAVSSDIDNVFKEIFVALIQSKILEFKVAVTKKELGIFHEKYGIFYDEFSNIIAISGSNNETISAVVNNSESFNAFCSWKNGQEEYVYEHIKDFEAYWNEMNQNNILYSLEEIIGNNLFVNEHTVEDISKLYEKLEKYKEFKNSKEINSVNLTFQPYDYQEKAVENWFEKKSGIFKFATGSGKTKTAIYLITKYVELFKKGFFIIVVPDKTLVQQWADEFIENKIKVVKCYSDNTKWREQSKEVVDMYLFNKSMYGILVVTKNLFFSEIFDVYMKKVKDFVFIVDECHNVGTENYLSKLPNVEYKLGLSATPEVYFSSERTDELFKYFGGIIAEYSLEDAIREKKLVEYEYHPIFVNLNDKEKEKYKKLTLDIIKIIGKDDDTKAFSNEDAKLLLFQRARIVYGAISKIDKLREIVSKISKKGHLIIYCGATSYSEIDDVINVNHIVQESSFRQIELVNATLAELNIDAAQYTESETGEERLVNIEQFKKGTFSTLVAIKCLDEGVNIEEIERAIIIASTNNPREFVQRRGRLLRKAPNKDRSEIYDFIVLEEDPLFNSMNLKEIQRMYEFSRLAINRDSLLLKYNDYFDKFIKMEEW